MYQSLYFTDIVQVKILHQHKITSVIPAHRLETGEFL